MKKSGRRLVIAPPSMAYSQDSKHSKVAADAVVAFEIDVIRVCRQRLLVIFFLYDTMQYVYVR